MCHVPPDSDGCLRKFGMHPKQLAGVWLNKPDKSWQKLGCRGL